MEKWKEEILEAYKQGKTIQARSATQGWHDFVPQNQLDRPNVNHGYSGEWRIKPDGDPYISDAMMGEIKKHEETVPFKDYRENECFTKQDMFLFAGFCTGYRERYPSTTANEMFDIWCATFKSK